MVRNVSGKSSPHSTFMATMGGSMIPGTGAGFWDTAFANYAISLSVGTVMEVISIADQKIYPNPKNQPKNSAKPNDKAKPGCKAPDGWTSYDYYMYLRNQGIYPV